MCLLLKVRDHFQYLSFELDVLEVYKIDYSGFPCDESCCPVINIFLNNLIK